MDSRLKEIKELWFKDHVATYTKINDDLRILDWKRPNSIEFSVRYVMDGHYLYITGDLYSAIFCFSDYATLEKLGRYNMYYFCSKLSTMQKKGHDFNTDLAIKQLVEKKNEFKEEYDYTESELKPVFDELIMLANDSSSSDDWANNVNFNYTGDIFDYDMHEWVYDIGEETSIYLIAYLTGLQMAYEQIFGGNKGE